MNFYRLFWKLFIKYVSFFFFLIACCILIAGISYQKLSDYILENNQLQYQKNITDFSNNINSLESFSLMMPNNSDFRILMSHRGDYIENKLISLNNSRTIFNYASFIYPQSPYSFSLFRYNDLFVSSSHISYDFETYYNNYMEIEIPGQSSLSAEEFREVIFDLAELAYDNPFFYKTTSASFYYNGKQNTINDALLCVINVSSSLRPSCAVVYLINPQELIQQVLPSQLYNQGLLRILDSESGEILLEYGKTYDPGADEYYYFHYPVEGTNLEAYIGMPNTMITEQAYPILVLLLFIIIVGFVFVISTSVLLSLRQYNQFCRLYSCICGKKIRISKRNDEYNEIYRILGNISNNQTMYQERLNTLSHQIDAIYLENLVVNGITNANTSTMLQKMFPKGLDFFCVAIVHISNAEQIDNNMVMLCINEYLQTHYSERFVNVHIGTENELVYLFQMNHAEQASVRTICVLFEDLISMLTTANNVTFNVGISAIGTELKNICICYAQAEQILQAYYQESQNIVNNYSLEKFPTNNNLTSMKFLTLLQNLLMNANYNAINSQLHQFMIQCQKQLLVFEIQKPQVFYSIRNVIHNASLQMPTGMMNELNLPEYQNYTLPQMIQVLDETCQEFCKLIEDNKRSRNNELKEQLLNYIANHYSDNQLTATMVSHAIGISEKYLFQFIREQTGQTFGEYLESLRIEKAVEYLKQTSYSNEQIAQMTGFTSTTTFYRAFNRRQGLSPGTFRHKI